MKHARYLSRVPCLFVHQALVVFSFDLLHGSDVEQRGHKRDFSKSPRVHYIGNLDLVLALALHFDLCFVLERDVVAEQADLSLVPLAKGQLANLIKWALFDFLVIAQLARSPWLHSLDLFLCLSCVLSVHLMLVSFLSCVVDHPERGSGLLYLALLLIIGLLQTSCARYWCVD